MLERIRSSMRGAYMDVFLAILRAIDASLSLPLYVLWWLELYIPAQLLCWLISSMNNSTSTNKFKQATLHLRNLIKSISSF